MSESENKDQAKGFKGLSSLPSKPDKLSEPSSVPGRRAETPQLPPAWSQSSETPSQRRQAQSATAASPWRGWIVGLGILGAVALFFIWVMNQSSPRRNFSSPSITSQQPSSALAAPIANPARSPSEPVITKPPVGSGLVFTSHQIRYCVFEDIRIKGAERVVDNYDQWSVDTFNAMVEDFNSRCGSFRYRSGALAPIEREAEGLRAKLENEGRARLRIHSVSDASSAPSEMGRSEIASAATSQDIPSEFSAVRELQEAPVQSNQSDASTMEGFSTESESAAYSNQGAVRPESLSDDERSSIELACIIAKTRGPAAYDSCMDGQLQQLTHAPRTPRTAGLSYDERSAIELACITRKSRGPADYNRCLVEQIDAMADAPRQPSMAGLSYGEKSAIELACIVRKSQGAAAHNRCLATQVEALSSGPREPSMAGLSYDEKSSIELACITRKSSGAADHNRCLVEQLNQLEGAPRSPNMSGLSYKERSAVQLACIKDKSSGAAAYNRCLTGQLSSIGVTRN